MTQTVSDTSPEDFEDEDAPAPESGEIELALTAEACGERLDKTLSRLLPQYSRSRLQQWMEAGLIAVDGRPARAKMTVIGDERIVVRPQLSPEDKAFTAEDMPLSILHEDDSILVLDKPAGLVVHPAAGNWSGTLLNGLLHHVPAIARVPRAGIVHRLDKDTTGLMVVAKSIESQTALVRQLQARTVKREYLALVWGTPQSSGRIDASIGRHPRDRIKMAVTTAATGKPAVTHHERVAVGKLEDRAVSLIRCRLETGRTHQIRVHMQSVGFPLVGDALYGKPHLSAVFGRQALHACRLGLAHPATGKACEWTAQVPPDLAELVARAGIADVDPG